MKIIAFESILLFVFLIALCVPQPVLAHGGEPRIEISAERLNPGGVLQIRGVDFEYETEVEVMLVNPTYNMLIISFGTNISDVEGGFTQNITLPVDLPEGNYALRATTYDHVIFSPSFTVWGTAIDDQEGNVIRDQSDVQFEPMTPLPPGLAPTTVPQASALAEPDSKPSQSMTLALALLGIGILSLFGFRMIQRR